MVGITRAVSPVLSVGPSSYSAARQELFLWGKGTSGQLGNGAYRDSSVPVASELSGQISSATAGYDFTAILLGHALRI